MKAEGGSGDAHGADPPVETEHIEPGSSDRRGPDAAESGSLRDRRARGPLIRLAVGSTVLSSARGNWGPTDGVRVCGRAKDGSVRSSNHPSVVFGDEREIGLEWAGR
ncbi:unnamed protein product [Boreogadus saida]